MGLGNGYYGLFLHAIEKIIAMNNSFPSFRGAELWGRGAFPLSFRDLFSFWEFLKIHFSLFTIAPHKKFASAHPGLFSPESIRPT